MATAAPLRPPQGSTHSSTSSSSPSVHRRMLNRSGVSWTDDLPVCNLSDIGIAPNVVYLQDGKTMEAHQYADFSFNFRSDHNCYLYGLFDGHDGVKASQFAASRLPAELLLGQINPNYNPPDSSIRKVLYQAFSIVERGFFESIDDALAKKTYLQSQIDDRMPIEAAAKRYPDIFKRMKNLDNEIKGGTTAVVALIINNKLFVANVGECRALLCQLNSKTNHVEVQQISVDHNLYQAQEQARLKMLGLNVEKLQNRGKLGVNECTRCIGDYSVKGGYKEIEYLRDATSEPSISEPSITEGIIIDEYPGSFLILMSDDLYKSVQKCAKNVDPNDYIAQLTSTEILKRQSIEGVAEQVVEKIAYMHKYSYGKQPMMCRGDMTLIVRNFTHPVGTTTHPVVTHNSETFNVSVPYSYAGIPTCERPNIKLVMPSAGIYSTPHKGMGSYSSSTPSDDTPTNLIGGSTSGIDTGTTEALSGPRTSSRTHSLLLAEDDRADDFNEEDFFRPDQSESMELDTDGRVVSYIKFDSFYKEWNRHNTNNSNVKSRVAWMNKR
ncbi:TGF-beta-activated kinase 1 and MAP3K7-binding protein 1-like isoform X2 [Styela clava]|uniref:TGF-beta-activated kinase 1 and MAP3K7-binding protein 1-like isoform X2 n=1 Tax=Styela clava TaxID=7725 RepID=UPI00193A17F7|nr:TGF-beta-activated kinase 1 and MAP3K7-binding protein 1-like isoform X2 [Styela clava]